MAYFGSANLSNVAISSGLEWNVKVTARDFAPNYPEDRHNVIYEKQ